MAIFWWAKPAPSRTADAPAVPRPRKEPHPSAGPVAGIVIVAVAAMLMDADLWTTTAGPFLVGAGAVLLAVAEFMLVRRIGR